MLYGRGAEQAAIDELLAAARAERRSGVLVLRGEPGIGKTALLDHAAGACTGAAGWTVLRTAGVEAESDLPFAALQLLLAPALDGLPALPAPQRAALERAFGLAEPDTSGASGARLLVGLGVLGLLAELAEAGPVLCLVDDVQWCDTASADALLLAARRLRAEGVVVVLTAREGEGPTPAAGLPELRLTGLDEPSSRALLTHSAPTASEPTLRQLLTLAQGNPLALRELPTLGTTLGGALDLGVGIAAPAGVGLDGDGTAFGDAGPARADSAEAGLGGDAAALGDAGRAGSVGSPSVPAAPRGEAALPLVGRLQLAYHGQLSRLPAATQTLLLVAAAEESGELPVVLDAAGRLGALAADLAPAEEAGLVVAGGPTGRLGFRHPLLRSAVLSRAPLAQRLAAHAALAEALAERDVPGGDAAVRRAWHLVQAAPGPDEAVAATVERVAETAAARGGHTGAASAYERAALLSPAPEDVTRRLVLAAEAAAEAGEVDRAESLARRALARRPTDPVMLAHVMFIEGFAQFWRGAPEPAHRLMLDTADLVADAHPGPTARVLLHALEIARTVDEAAVRETLRRLAALELKPEDGLAPVVAYLLAASTGDAEAAPLARVLGDARAGGAVVPVDLGHACAAALGLGRDEEALVVTGEVVAEARAGGVLAVLPPLLVTLAEAELFQGRAAQARAHAEEALALAGDVRQSQWAAPVHSLLAHLAAQRGDEEACHAALRAADAGTHGGAAALSGAPWRQWAPGLLDLGLGRAEEAFAALDALVRGPDLGHIPAARAFPDALEAAVRLRRGEELAEPLAAFERWAARAERDGARALLLRCRALLAPDEFAEPLYRDALALHAGSGHPWDEARTALLFGEWLRRARRKSEARAPLRAAARAFDALDAAPWAARARAELDASGAAPVEPRAAGPLSGLTPQENQIVRLAAQGLSNRDIAAQLFLSSRTVGYHLYKAYPKLGVASRGELSALV
ncbi:DNA-binding CsgD family transcriptional regulator/tetratricopeptide (TPR) repeat protein [Streptacidiphilus sp. MAP12-33]|uniref:helix-turn-helix transcriptional regulator n=1 Tax=Streptacidiphilus sp. MAP12-33 TaxID=3156266 RepID=UPI0035191096